MITNANVPARAPSEPAEWDHDLAVRRAELGDEAWAVAWAEGQALTLEQVFDLSSGTTT